MELRWTLQEIYSISATFVSGHPFSPHEGNKCWLPVHASDLGTAL